MNRYPKISIVTPCFNHEKFIGDTIESVISQGYPNLEYIVINDGSTDGSEKVIRSYEKHLTRWETWPGHRPGPVWAINRGFSYATGEIFGWISSDDILLPKSLFVVAQAFNDVPEMEWVSGINSTINSRGEIVRSDHIYKNIYDFLIGNWGVIQQESTFFRRLLWEKAGGKLDEEFICAFDTELWTRFFRYAEHYHLDAPVGAFRKASQSRSVRNLEEFLGYNRKSLERMPEFVSSDVRKRAAVYRMMSVGGVRPIARKLSPFRYKVVRYSFDEDRWKVAEARAPQ